MGAERITIDEIQRAPNLLSAIKLEVDRKRTPGRLLCTGSANLLLMRQVSESLAGRAVYLEILPFTWSELERAQVAETRVDRKPGKVHVRRQGVQRICAVARPAQGTRTCRAIRAESCAGGPCEPQMRAARTGAAGGWGRTSRRSGSFPDPWTGGRK
jgi:hypothetical protein